MGAFLSWVLAVVTVMLLATAALVGVADTLFEVTFEADLMGTRLRFRTLPGTNMFTARETFLRNGTTEGGENSNQ